MSLKVAVIIMAGGEGTRFYPLSTPEHPKQFIDFFEDKPCLLKQTYDRACKITDPERVYVATNEKYAGKVASIVGHCNLIVEQKKKNTAPALANTMYWISREMGCSNFIAVCLPSDHYIGNEEYYIEKIKDGIAIAEGDNIATLGIKPSFPSTEYGYIKPLNMERQWPRIDRFIEKPSKELARMYVENGYLWNSGMFIWNYNTFVKELRTHCPEVLKGIGDVCYWDMVPPISIDYALMEKTSKGVLIPTELDWSDVGNWDSLKKLGDKVKLNPEIQKYVDRMVVKPWGYEDRWAIADDYVGKLLYIRKGHRLSLQYHEVKDETIMVLGGKMKLKLNDAELIMAPGQVQKIAPTDIHRMEATEDCIVLEVSTTELEDVVRIADDYKR